MTIHTIDDADLVEFTELAEMLTDWFAFGDRTGHVAKSFDRHMAGRADTTSSTSAGTSTGSAAGSIPTPELM